MAFRINTIVMLVLALFGASVPGMAGQNRSLSEHLPGWEVGRFPPQQPRLVLVHDDSIIVVRIGETVPGLPGVRLQAKDTRSALFEIRGADEASAATVDAPRWLLIRYLKNGSLEFVDIRRESDAAQVLAAIEDTSTAVPVLPSRPRGNENAGGAPGTDDGRSS